MISLSHFLVKLIWMIYPSSSRQKQEESREFLKKINEILPIPQRTEREQAEFEAAMEHRYLQEVTVILHKSEALRVTSDEQWKKGISLLRHLPIQFRIKFIESSNVTSWQPNLAKGVCDTYFIFPAHGTIFYDEVEWLELDASQLSEKELAHFRNLLHDIHIQRYKALLFSMQVWRLVGYCKFPQEDIITH